MSTQTFEETYNTGKIGVDPYLIIGAKELHNLVPCVLEAVQEGYEPKGGVGRIQHGDMRYVQTIWNPDIEVVIHGEIQIQSATSTEGESAQAA